MSNISWGYVGNIPMPLRGGDAPATSNAVGCDSTRAIPPRMRWYCRAISCAIWPHPVRAIRIHSHSIPST